MPKQLTLPFMAEYKRNIAKKKHELLHSILPTPSHMFYKQEGLDYGTTDSRISTPLKYPRFRDLPRPLRTYHGSYEGRIRGVYPGLHTGNAPASYDRAGLSKGTYPVSGNSNPTRLRRSLYRLSLDIRPGRTLGTPRSPLRDTSMLGDLDRSHNYTTIHNRLSKYFDAAFYMNRHENPGTVSVLVFNHKIIRKLKEVKLKPNNFNSSDEF